MQASYLKLDSFESVINFLIKRNETVIIENESLNTKRFLLGKIESLISNIVSVSHIDAEGNIVSKPRKLKLEEITQIQIKTRYIKMFEKYSK